MKKEIYYREGKYNSFFRVYENPDKKWGFPGRHLYTLSAKNWAFSIKEQKLLMRLVLLNTYKEEELDRRIKEFRDELDEIEKEWKENEEIEKEWREIKNEKRKLDG